MVCPSVISVVRIAAARAELVIGAEVGVTIRSGVRLKPPPWLILVALTQPWKQARMYRGYVRHSHVIAGGNAGQHRRDVVQYQLDYA